MIDNKELLKSWDKKPTSIISIEGKPTEVSKLPENIRFKIETLDKIKFEYLDIVFKQKTLDLAIKALLNEITVDIQQHFSPPKQKTGEDNDIRKE